MLMAAIPRKNKTSESVFLLVTSPALNNKKPITRLNSDQITFTGAEDNPLPGGLANGDGNLLPEMPCTKCGTAFAKNAPAKKQAKY
jgi:hypothetical protein